MFHHAAGGYGGQGTLCGSIGSCAAIINLVAADDKKTHSKLAADLIAWYAQTSFPSNRFDDIAKHKDQLQLVPNSPLCHVSVSSWMMAAKTNYDGKDRKDRCAKVTADTVYKMVEMLNQHVDGSYKMVGAKLTEYTESCLSCHGPKAANNQRGEMDCLSCHDDHTK